MGYKTKTVTRTNMKLFHSIATLLEPFVP